MTESAPTKVEATDEASPLTKLAIDLGPLVVYLIAYWFTKQVILSTGLFMAATAAAIVASRVLHGKVSAMLWFSGVMVIVLGGLTIWTHDPRFIQMKPTIYYLLVAAILGFGLVTGRQLLKIVLGQAYPGLTDLGWTKLTRNWTLFFIVMAGANELVWRTTNMDFWLGYKLWGAMPATLLFAIANIPMLMKHGLSSERAEGQPPLPPQG